MKILAKLKKAIGREPLVLDPIAAIQQVNAQIVACPNYACAVPGQIFCAAKQQFVTLDTCATCRREG